MRIVISAAFSDPHRAFGASEALRQVGIVCKHQIGRRVAHWPVNSVKQAAHYTFAHVMPMNCAVQHPAVVLNILSSPKKLEYTRRILHKFHGREI